MGIGFKYHVTTIAAIFSALAIGLIVGSLFASPQLVAQQTRTIRQLQNTLDKDIKDKSNQIKRYQQFASSVLPVVIDGRLTGIHVAIVQTGDYPDITTHVRDTLNAAGATVLSTTTIERAWDQTEDALNATLADLHANDARIPTDRAALARLVATTLAHGDSPENSLLGDLEKARLIVREPGSDYQIAANYVLFVAGSRSDTTSRLSNVDQPLILALQREQVHVIACEPENASVSDMLAYQKLNLSLPTVDNVDSDIGQCALVLAFQSAPDSYGVKSGEDLKMPAVSR